MTIVSAGASGLIGVVSRGADNFSRTAHPVSPGSLFVSRGNSVCVSYLKGFKVITNRGTNVLQVGGKRASFSPACR